MKQITIRSIPNEIEKIVKKEASEKGLSLNKAFISLLERGSVVKAIKKRKTLYHDLDHLSGIWSDEEAARFNSILEMQRKIDEDLWKKKG
ncbi:MAG: hypothetical protein C0415_00510 [Thermodesulfovibrio sp.]|nr:hypothetical protein [Thermodesulfovibrio sp.]